jgi:hypothetical protein
MRRASIVACVLSIISCDQANRMAGNNDKDSGLIFGQDDMMSPGDTDGMMSLPDDLLMTIDYDAFAGVDGGNAYVTDLSRAGDAAGACAPGQMGISCAAPIGPNAGCLPVEICNNGQDDNCDPQHQVDEGCSCTPGDVQPCFVGAPGNRHVGACTDGQQTCIQVGEATGWGDCVGSIGPSVENCDGLDNDCNGCVDDGLCCGGVSVMCPGPGDARISPVAPFATKSYKGADFFNGTATSWTWKVEGGPCDRLFASSDFTPKMNPPAQSFKTTTSGTNGQDASIYFSLSGDYTVTLTIVDDSNHTYTCKWVQHVSAPGVRFELCWDHMGTVAQGGADLDLHVHKSGTTSGWFLSPTTLNLGACRTHGNPCPAGGTCMSGNCVATVNDISSEDCNYYNCTATEYSRPPVTAGAAVYTDPLNPTMPPPPPDWYPNSSPDTLCSGSKYGKDWDKLGYCHNPRLDLDNVVDIGAPENTNINNPANNDTFRVLVHYYGQEFRNSTNMVVEHPIVNIYCGGTLKATYGQAPNQISGFNFGSGFGKGQLWRVADVSATVDGTGATTDCKITALHPMGMTTGYRVATDPNNTNLTYDGF